MAKRAKIGDIVQILTSKGIAYAQFTHKHNEYGYLLAVFKGFYKSLPGDFSQIVSMKPQFFVFFPLQSAKWAFVVAIFREFYSKTPKDFTEVVAGEPQFITTFLIQDGVRRGFFSLVGEVPVPEHLIEFPTFRGTNHLQGEETMWFFWNGEREWKVHRPLTPEEKKYPEGPSLLSAPLLIELIEKDYRVERDYI